MALALRSSQRALSFSWARTVLSSTVFAAAELPRVAHWSLDSLLDLFPSIVLAVPKKKVSHSRKAMRASNKGLKDKQNIVSCPGCGAPKLAHHYCQQCYSEITRQWKAERRQESSIPEL